jgi:RNA polymerase sigma-70 factor (ECF subfamily)
MPMTLALSTADDDLVAPTVPAKDEASWSELYDEHFDFVWRSLRRLGVQTSSLDDATQEVFLVAIRRQDAFEGRSALKTWLFGITWNIARNLSRSRASHEEPLPEAVMDMRGVGQEEAAARSEAVRTLYRVLDRLDPDKRDVFVMVELEEMGAKEVAEITGAPINTVYSRLRAARAEFEAGLERLRKRDGWRGR